MGVGEAGRGENVGYVAPQDTSVSLDTEADLMSQPVVTQESQDYLDTLGTFEFDPDDFQTTTTQPSEAVTDIQDTYRRIYWIR